MQMMTHAVTLVILLAAMWVFFVPTMEAYKRRHSKRNTIFHVNFWLGWTVIGWIVAFIWSQTDDSEGTGTNRKPPSQGA